MRASDMPTGSSTSPQNSPIEDNLSKTSSDFSQDDPQRPPLVSLPSCTCSMGWLSQYSAESGLNIMRMGELPVGSPPTPARERVALKRTPTTPSPLVMRAGMVFGSPERELTRSSSKGASSFNLPAQQFRPRWSRGVAPMELTQFCSSEVAEEPGIIATMARRSLPPAGLPPQLPAGSSSPAVLPLPPAGLPPGLPPQLPAGWSSPAVLPLPKRSTELSAMATASTDTDSDVDTDSDARTNVSDGSNAPSHPPTNAPAQVTTASPASSLQRKKPLRWRLRQHALAILSRRRTEKVRTGRTSDAPVRTAESGSDGARHSSEEARKIKMSWISCCLPRRSSGKRWAISTTRIPWPSKANCGASDPGDNASETALDTDELAI